MAKITKNNFIKAAKNTGGVMAIIARRLGTTRGAITLFCQRNEWTKQVLADESEYINDLAETKLFEKINNGEWKAIEFHLKTKAKSRGYVERQEIVSSGILSITPSDFRHDYEEYLVMQNPEKEGIIIGKQGMN